MEYDVFGKLLYKLHNGMIHKVAEFFTEEEGKALKNFINAYETKLQEVVDERDSLLNEVKTDVDLSEIRKRLKALEEAKSDKQEGDENGRSD